MKHWMEWRVAYFQRPCTSLVIFLETFLEIFRPCKGTIGSNHQNSLGPPHFFLHTCSRLAEKSRTAEGVAGFRSSAEIWRKGIQLSRIWSGSKPNDFIWSHMDPYEPIGPQFGWWYCSCPILWVEVVNLYPSPTHGFSHFGEVLGATEKLLQGMATWVTNSNPLWIMWEYNYCNLFWVYKTL